MQPWTLLARLTPQHPPPADPRRIVLILPCCIGDVVLGTAVLCALRRAYPHAQITWAVGGWSKRAVEGHPLLDAVLDTGPLALPVRSPRGFWGFVRQMRAGRYDLAVSLVRSPLMSAALLLSAIPHRAGPDSAGRGFGYTLRAPVDPHQPRHEAEVYLDVARALGVETAGCWANVPVQETDRARVQALDLPAPYIVINPAGGRNPGMTLDSKRWPPQSFAQLAQRLAARYGAQIVLLGGPKDGDILAAVRSALRTEPRVFAGELSFGEIAALASGALLYIGNDTGLTHLAAAAGARTVMILGPSDPARYAPFVPDALALWKPTVVTQTGVAGGAPPAWDWARDGISAAAAEQEIIAFVEARR